MVGDGGRYDRAACRDMTQTCREVARARQRETAFAAWTLTTVDAVEGSSTPFGVAMNPRCGMWLVVLGLCALSLSEGRG